MKYLLSLLLLLLPMVSQAAPFLVSDPTTQEVSHCGLLLDDLPKTTSVVEVVEGGKRCKIDIASVGAGVHTAKATFINSTWGVESQPSVALTFTKMGTLSAPVGFRIEP